MPRIPNRRDDDREPIAPDPATPIAEAPPAPVAPAVATPPGDLPPLPADQEGSDPAVADVGAAPLPPSAPLPPIVPTEVHEAEADLLLADAENPPRAAPARGWRADAERIYRMVSDELLLATGGKRLPSIEEIDRAIDSAVARGTPRRGEAEAEAMPAAPQSSPDPEAAAARLTAEALDPAWTADPAVVARAQRAVMEMLGSGASEDEVRGRLAETGTRDWLNQYAAELGDGAREPLPFGGDVTEGASGTTPPARRIEASFGGVLSRIGDAWRGAVGSESPRRGRSVEIELPPATRYSPRGPSVEIDLPPVIPYDPPKPPFRTEETYRAAATYHRRKAREAIADGATRVLPIPTDLIAPRKRDMGLNGKTFSDGRYSPEGAYRTVVKDGKSVPKPHRGIDLSALIGEPVMAASSGRLVLSGKVTDYGNVIAIAHDDGYTSIYAHLKEFSIPRLNKADPPEGRWIDIGTDIGLIGTSGNAKESGSHLHFQVAPTRQKLGVLRKGAETVDPVAWLRGQVPPANTSD